MMIRLQQGAWTIEPTRVSGYSESDLDESLEVQRRLEEQQHRLRVLHRMLDTKKRADRAFND